MAATQMNIRMDAALKESGNAALARPRRLFEPCGRLLRYKALYLRRLYGHSIRTATCRLARKTPPRWNRRAVLKSSLRFIDA